MPLKALTGLLCLMFPVGLIIMLTDFGRPYLWTTTIFLSLQALILILTLLRFANAKSVIISVIIVFILSFLVEYAGVSTKFPFGNYSYTASLIPGLSGVPLAISFAWISVTVSSLLFAKTFLVDSGVIVISLVSAVFILATDILLEPFASFANGFWTWENNLIPFQNFVSWFVIGFIFSFLFEKFIMWDKEKITEKNLLIIPVIIIFINLINFSVINIIYGYFLFTLAGLSIFVSETFLLIKFRNF